MPTSSSNEIALDEWKEARKILARFDENLHDLRKYGFTFIAALLAANSIQVLISLEVKMRFALIVITIAFVVSLHFLDHNYRQFQKAASIRAMILERTLNIEITETIWERYRSDWISFYSVAVYILFVVIAGGLGYIILSDIYQVWSLYAALGGIILILIPLGTLRVTLGHVKGKFKEDWIIDRVTCEHEKEVRITVTNLDEKKGSKFNLHDTVFQIADEDGNFVDQVKAERETCIPIDGNHSWFWNTKKAKPGNIYRVWPRGRGVPLRRSILVVPAQKPILTRTKEGTRKGQPVTAKSSRK